ncbi:MAG: hypothetical protein ABIF77_10505 [bacterium]
MAKYETIIKSAVGPEDIHLALGIDPVDHRICILVGFEPDVYCFTTLIDIIGVFVMPDVDSQRDAVVIHPAAFGGNGFRSILHRSGLDRKGET